MKYPLRRWLRRRNFWQQTARTKQRSAPRRATGTSGPTWAGLEPLESRLLLSTTIAGPMSLAATNIAGPAIGATIAESTLPTVLEPGQAGYGTIKTTVTNTGSLSLPHGLTVTMTVIARPVAGGVDQVLASRSAQLWNVGPGQSQIVAASVSLPNTLAAGNYRIMAFLQAPGYATVVAASNVNLSIGSGPSAAASTPAALPSLPALAGTTLSGVITEMTVPLQIDTGTRAAGVVTTAVTNQSNANIPGGTAVDVTVLLRPLGGGKDIVIGSRSDQMIGHLSSGAAKDLRVLVAVPANTPDGNYRVVSHLNAPGIGVFQSNTNINITVGSGAIGLPIDQPVQTTLAAKVSDSTVPTQVAAGEKTSGFVTTTISNISGATIPGGTAVNVTVLLRPIGGGAEIVIGTRDNQLIGHLGSGVGKDLRVQVSVPETVPGGKYQIVTRVDGRALPDVGQFDSTPAAATVMVSGAGNGGGVTTPVSDTVAKAIARWDVVPYQTVAGKFEVGVVAFHINGIDRVEFFVNNKLAATVKQIKLNPRTGVVEYFFVFDAAKYPDGAVTIDAVVYPTNGAARALRGPFDAGANTGEYSLTLYANSQNTLKRQQIVIGPGDSLAAALLQVADGGEILLKKGVYDLPNMQGKSPLFDGWVTIRPVDGLKQSDVTIRPAVRKTVVIKGSKIHWKNLTFDFARIERFMPYSGDLHWFDNVRWYDSNGWATDYDRYFTPMHAFGRAFMTDSLVEDMIYGPAGLELVRGATVKKISGDVFQNTHVVLNSTITNVESDILKHHTDIFQYWAPQDTRLVENRIVYNVSGSQIHAQHFFLRTGGGGTFRDFAFVNVDLRLKAGLDPRAKTSQLYGNNEHVLFINVNSGHRFLLRGPGEALAGEEFVPVNVLFKDSNFNDLTFQKFEQWPELNLVNNSLITNTY